MPTEEPQLPSIGTNDHEVAADEISPTASGVSSEDQPSHEAAGETEIGAVGRTLAVLNDIDVNSRRVAWPNSSMV